MLRIEKTVFISYRRTNFPWALAIFQDLTHHGYDVFFDYEGIGPGDFESVILANITSRAHFLIVLTPSALERCGEPGDWLRREIETAVESKRNVVPLMLEGFSFGTPAIASQLTGGIASLKNYNGLGMPAEYFLAAMEKLRTKFLNIPLAAVPQPASRVARRAATEQKAAAIAAPPVLEEELTAQQHLERAVAALSPSHRMVFVLHDVEGFNHREIAEMLDCSVVSVKAQLYKARLKLRRDLNVGDAEKWKQTIREITDKRASNTPRQI